MERRAASLRRLDAFRSGDIEAVTGSTPASPARFLPIRRFMCRRRRGSLGSPRFGYRIWPVSKPAARNCSRLPTVSRKSVPLRVILPFGNSSSELLHFANAARRSFDASCAYPGFRPSARQHQPASTFAKASQAPASFRPRALSTPRRFAPQAGLQAYFIPQPCPGPILFRGSFSPRSRTVSSTAHSCPHAVSTVSLIGRPVAAMTMPRLRGFAPREGT
jgi:hypothetical protein